MSEFIDIRCPVGPQSLLMRMVPMERPQITSENLVELACSDCARTLRKKGRNVLRVLHRYDLSGELVETLCIPR